ncbi:putative prophage repressor [Pseudomonas knackmussii B13]|uniref:Putative prophage repressor n=1 Tax=Pseudomonas knackmussii (strain DSM 6978 / CCUG 54928 / LMG 23759 / B13) TaxID=1301098 RepID=A0A024HC55_PSEKB|nr:LexA family transcriptional regulator [Pseudomonas knackmussii]CDF82630.1 putative prophage repressor [Pseudomonas knackmussii B13]
MELPLNLQTKLLTGNRHFCLNSNKGVCSFVSMNTPTERQAVIAALFRKRREELKLSQSEVAKGVRELLGGEVFTQQSYAAIEKGKTKHSKYLAPIARVLGIPPQAVDPSYPGPNMVKDTVIAYGEKATVVGPAGRKLPVVGSIAAGSWVEAIDLFQPGDAEEWIDSPGPVGPGAFVLIVEGISMKNPNGPVSFESGDRVVIDPSIEAQTGDFVAAKLTGSNRVTFKRLQCEDGEWYLEAINPGWDPRYIRMSEEWHICGKAMWRVQKL